MAVNSVSNVTGALLNGGKIVSQDQQGQLGMNDFFTLMAAQLQYQDPMNPTDNNQFMAQMAQFGMLEQLTNLSNSYNFMMASSMVGKQVEFSTYDDRTGQTSTGSGNVDSVDVSTGSPQCLVGGKWIAISDIKSINTESSGNA